MSSAGARGRFDRRRARRAAPRCRRACRCAIRVAARPPRPRAAAAAATPSCPCRARSRSAAVRSSAPRAAGRSRVRGRCRRSAATCACRPARTVRRAARRSRASIPMPLSVTAKRTSVGLPGSGAARTSSETAPRSVNLIALLRKLLSTWRRRSPSTITCSGTRARRRCAASSPFALATPAKICVDLRPRRRAAAWARCGSRASRPRSSRNRGCRR